MKHLIQRRVLPLLLSLFMVFSCACGAKNPPEKESTPNASFKEFTDELYRSEVAADTLTLHYSLAHPENYDIC